MFCWHRIYLFPLSTRRPVRTTPLCVGVCLLFIELWMQLGRTATDSIESLRLNRKTERPFHVRYEMDDTA
jgi:hypothetical protein